MENEQKKYSYYKKLTEEEKEQNKQARKAKKALLNELYLQYMTKKLKLI